MGFTDVLGKNLSVAAVLALCLTGCAGAEKAGEHTAGVQADEELVVYCPHPPGLINPIVAEFESRTGIDVRVCTGGTGKLLGDVATREEPLCDVFWGGSLTTLERSL